MHACNSGHRRRRHTLNTLGREVRVGNGHGGDRAADRAGAGSAALPAGRHGGGAQAVSGYGRETQWESVCACVCAIRVCLDVLGAQFNV